MPLVSVLSVLRFGLPNPPTAARCVSCWTRTCAATPPWNTWPWSPIDWSRTEGSWPEDSSIAPWFGEIWEILSVSWGLVGLGGCFGWVLLGVGWLGFRGVLGWWGCWGCRPWCFLFLIRSRDQRPYERLEYLLWVWELWQPLRAALRLEKRLETTQVRNQQGYHFNLSFMMMRMKMMKGMTILIIITISYDES